MDQRVKSQYRWFLVISLVLIVLYLVNSVPDNIMEIL